MSWLVLVLGAYLVGSISFSLLFVRRLHDVDIRSQGSGNAGATNVLRVSGWHTALAVLMLDVGKGALSVVAAKWLEAPGPVIGLVAVAAISGHIFPVFHGFRGGKGVATVCGAMVALAPVPTVLAALFFLLVAGLTRFVALASVSACVAFPFLLIFSAHMGWSETPPSWLLLSAAAIAALIVGKHKENMVRIRRGSEWRLGDGRDAGTLDLDQELDR